MATATAKDQRDTENGVSTGVLSKLKLVLGGSGNGGGKGPSISSPTGFKYDWLDKIFFLKPTCVCRHVVHVSGTTIEMYGEHGSGSPVPSSSGQNGGAKREGDLEMVTMSRIDGSFGMNLKTLDNGKTLISKINERGAAELTGQLIVNDEIVMIDGEKIRGWKHNDVINLLKDKTTVQLHIEKVVFRGTEKRLIWIPFFFDCRCAKQHRRLSLCQIRAASVEIRPTLTARPAEST